VGVKGKNNLKLKGGKNLRGKKKLGGLSTENGPSGTVDKAKATLNPLWWKSTIKGGGGEGRGLRRGEEANPIKRWTPERVRDPNGSANREQTWGQKGTHKKGE